MRKYFIIILLFTVIASQAQHAFFRGNNNYVAPTAVATTQANALHFDGIDDYVDCGINTSLNLRSSMTIELWIKPNQNMGNGKWDRLVNKDWYTGYFFGGKEGATNALAVALSGDLNAAVTPNNTIDIGVWQHVGFVFDDPANTIKIYKNGVLISTSTWNGTITGNPNSSLTLSQSSETFNGAMDDVRIWNVARTQTEIQTNMNTELADTETGLKAYYPFNQGIAAGNNTTIITVTDKTANALNGTLTNFAKSGATSNFVLGKVDQINNGSTTVPTVTSASGRIWMDRNLGASQVATAFSDALSYGDLYQWGRGADGHQLRTSANTSTTSSSDVPGHGNFITNSTDWRSPQNTSLWQGVNGVNNPCPSGYRLPTQAEFSNEESYFSPKTYVGAMSSVLKLPMAGYRSNTNGAVSNSGSSGYYWTSTVSASKSADYFFNNSNSNMNTIPRSFGLSVRCIKD